MPKQGRTSQERYRWAGTILKTTITTTTILEQVVTMATTIIGQPLKKAMPILGQLRKMVPVSSHKQLTRFYLLQHGPASASLLCKLHDRAESVVKMN